MNYEYGNNNYNTVYKNFFTSLNYKWFLLDNTDILFGVSHDHHHHLFDLIADRLEIESKIIAECVPNYLENKETELKKRSVIYWSEELDKSSSLLILCGTNDKRVNPEQADKVAHKLTEIKYDYELRKFETDHFFSAYKTELNELAIEWFDKRLKN
jgi:hypothetical protein